MTYNNSSKKADPLSLDLGAVQLCTGQVYPTCQIASPFVAVNYSKELQSAIHAACAQGNLFSEKKDLFSNTLLDDIVEAGIIFRTCLQPFHEKTWEVFPEFRSLCHVFKTHRLPDAIALLIGSLGSVESTNTQFRLNIGLMAKERKSLFDKWDKDKIEKLDKDWAVAEVWWDAYNVSLRAMNLEYAGDPRVMAIVVEGDQTFKMLHDSVVPDRGNSLPIELAVLSSYALDLKLQDKTLAGFPYLKYELEDTFNNALRRFIVKFTVSGVKPRGAYA